LKPGPAHWPPGGNIRVRPESGTIEGPSIEKHLAFFAFSCCVIFFNYVSDPRQVLVWGDGVVVISECRRRAGRGTSSWPLSHELRAKEAPCGGGLFLLFLFKFTNLKKKTKKARAPQYYFFRAGGRRGGLPPRRWWRPFVFG
jgi:hypothetical protein